MKNFIAAFLIAFAFTSCAPLKPLEFRSVSDLKVTNLSSSPEVSVNMNLYNPNAAGCTLKDLNVEFSLSGSHLADMSLDKLRLPSHSDISVPLAIQVSYSDLMNFLPSGLSLFSSGKDIPVLLKGNLTLKKFIFKRTFPFELHQTINAKDIGVK